MPLIIRKDAASNTGLVRYSGGANTDTSGSADRRTVVLGCQGKDRLDSTSNCIDPNFKTTLADVQSATHLLLYGTLNY